MKKTYIIGTAVYFTAAVCCSRAMDVKDAAMDFEQSCYVNPFQRGEAMNVEIASPQPYTSTLLEQKHPGGMDNDLTGVNQYRGEGLPYISFVRLHPQDRALVLENSAHILRNKGIEKILSDIYHEGVVTKVADANIELPADYIWK